MSEEQIKGPIRGFLKSTTQGDVNQSISFLAPDAVWVTQSGTFKGVEEIKKYISWTINAVKDQKVVETGVGIVVQGNTGIIEHTLSGVTRGKKWEVPAMCIYEFKDDKIIAMRSFMDRLSLAKQGAKGMFEKWFVNAIINAIEKGLH